MEFIIEFVSYLIHMATTGFGICTIVLTIVYGGFIRSMVKRNTYDVDSEEIEA